MHVYVIFSFVVNNVCFFYVKYINLITLQVFCFISSCIVCRVV